MQHDDEEVLEAVPVMLLTNDPTEFKLQTMDIIYNSIANGQLGYMDAKDPETGEIVPLLVGIDPTADGKFRIFPVARILMGTDVPKYLVPDGSGQYYEVEAGEPIDVTAELGGIVRDDDAPEEESGPTEGLHKNQIN